MRPTTNPAERWRRVHDYYPPEPTIPERLAKLGITSRSYRERKAAPRGSTIGVAPTPRPAPESSWLNATSAGGTTHGNP
jgi:hypothetical protein